MPKIIDEHTDVKEVGEFVYETDNRKAAMDIIKSWFNGDERVSFKLEDYLETDENGIHQLIPVLVAIVPAFSDGNLYTHYTIKPGNTVSVTRKDIWPVMIVK